jgi:hypothetical protein
MTTLTTETAFDVLSEQVMRCHIGACAQMRGIPQLKTVMTLPTWNAVTRHIKINHHVPIRKSDPYGPDGAEFRGSKITIVPGEDLFCHTRCTNLP